MHARLVAAACGGAACQAARTGRRLMTKPRPLSMPSPRPNLETNRKARPWQVGMALRAAQGGTAGGAAAGGAWGRRPVRPPLARLPQNALHLFRVRLVDQLRRPLRVGCHPRQQPVAIHVSQPEMHREAQSGRQLRAAGIFRASCAPPRWKSAGPLQKVAGPSQQVQLKPLTASCNCRHNTLQRYMEQSGIRSGAGAEQQFTGARTAVSQRMRAASRRSAEVNNFEGIAIKSWVCWTGSISTPRKECSTGGGSAAPTPQCAALTP